MSAPDEEAIIQEIDRLQRKLSVIQRAKNVQRQTNNDSSSLPIEEPPKTQPKYSRLLIVANRLPISLQKSKPKGQSRSPTQQKVAPTLALPVRTPMSKNPEQAEIDNLLSRNAKGTPSGATVPPALGESEMEVPSITGNGECEEENKQDEKWVFKVSSGGLVSALNSVKGLQMVWIGWPGTEVPHEDEEYIRGKLKETNMVPVFFPKELEDLYYCGFSNGIIWPLFHYFPPDIDVLQSADAKFEGYEAANHEFAKAVMAEYEEGDLVWVQDYHLMLLPAILRKEKPSIKVGFFLHTPFPSSEIYKALPWREELLLGVLSSDLIGFHTHDYTRHFHSACAIVTGASVSSDEINYAGGITTTGTFPIGIDPASFINALQKPQVQGYIQEFKEKFKGRRVILGIDRLDYTKGLPHKLYAMERFLDRNRDWIGKVVLVQIAVPSRTDVMEYKRLSRKVHELVGRINGQYGSLTQVPIHFLDQSIPFEQMCALYHISDAAICSSIRDGMNLVAYEYIACQYGSANPGVLILSEFTGASHSIGAGAVRVNPWDVGEMAQAINYALSLSAEERMEHWQYANTYVHKYTAQHWAESFVKALHNTSDSNNAPVVPSRLSIEEVAKAFSEAKNRVIISGVIGTLTKKNAKGVSMEQYHVFSRSSGLVHYLVDALANDPKTTFVALSSRTRAVSENIIGETNAWLGAENGYFLRRGREKPWEQTFENVDLSWMSGVRDVLKHFEDRTPHARTEVKETYLSWHYPKVHFAAAQARDLLTHLLGGPLANAPTSVVHHQEVIQIRPAAVTKAFAAERILAEIEAVSGPVDFVLCIGSFLREDEDIFDSCFNQQRQVPHRHRRSMSMSTERGADGSPTRVSGELDSRGRCVFTVTVGRKVSRAKAYVDSALDVERLFARLCESLPTVPQALVTLRRTKTDESLGLRLPPMSRSMTFPTFPVGGLLDDPDEV